MKHVCVKKSNLNKLGYENFREWLEDENNVYVGRKGRMSLKEKDGRVILYHYKGSKWGNPFVVNEEMSIEESLRLYEKHIYKSGLDKHLEELEGKNLGCFCEENSPCHAKILVKLLKGKK